MDFDCGTIAHLHCHLSYTRKLYGLVWNGTRENISKQVSGIKSLTLEKKKQQKNKQTKNICCLQCQLSYAIGAGSVLQLNLLRTLGAGWVLQ